MTSTKKYALGDVGVDEIIDGEAYFHTSIHLLLHHFSMDELEVMTSDELGQACHIAEVNPPLYGKS